MSRAKEVFNVSRLIIIIKARESITHQGDPEVNAKPERRKFSAEYKRRIIEEADACTEAGQRGALLRREELYSSNLTHWRQQMSKGALKALSPKKRGPKSDPLANENAALRPRIERLEAEIKRAETIIEVQKKLSELLGL